MFLPAGLQPRPDACCPVCGSLERHRSMWLYLSRFTTLLDRPGRLLHIAPEPCIEARLRKCESIRYLSGDLDGDRAMVLMDVTCIDFPDDSFDVIYCSHVLEHVPDDERAMREFRRVLRPGGISLIQVPIEDRDSTYEDDSIDTPEQRLLAFGQSDHVRIYGRDFPDRLTNAGFSVQAVELRNLLPPGEVVRFGIGHDAPIFVCRRNGTDRTSRMPNTEAGHA